MNTTRISPEPLNRGFAVSFVLAGPGGRVPLLVVTRKSILPLK